MSNNTTPATVADAKSRQRQESHRGRTGPPQRQLKSASDTNGGDVSKTASCHRLGSVQTCPECSSNVTADEVAGETVCTDCGLVVAEGAIDPGPEWRASDPQERQELSRVGAPVTKSMHDDGLTTVVGDGATDARGNLLSSRQRARANRIRRWQTRVSAGNGTERTVKLGCNEVHRMVSALDLPDETREIAAVIYRRAAEEDLLPGRSYEAVASAAIYIGARKSKAPRTFKQVADASHVDRAEIESAYRFLCREIKAAQTLPATPQKHVPHVVENLTESDDELKQMARSMLDEATEHLYEQGKSPSPVSLAAAAVYAAGVLLEKEITQQDVSDAADATAVTVRKYYRKLIELGTDTDLPDISLRAGEVAT